MARTEEEVFNELITEKETFAELQSLLPTGEANAFQNLLSQLETSSNVAEWRLMYSVVAFSIATHEGIFDLDKLDVQSILDNAIVGTPSWYRDQSFKFQLGDSLEVVEDDSGNFIKFGYATLDTSKQIIQRCAVITNADQVTVKIAKLTGTVPTKLTNSEKTSFTAYLNQIKIAGTKTAIISENADILQLEYDVTYSPLVLSSTGESINEPTVFPVNDAIDNYISGLDFNGTLSITQLTDAVQAVTGVTDVLIKNASATSGLLTPTTMVTSYDVIANSYESVAGHMKIDPSNPLIVNYTSA